MQSLAESGVIYGDRDGWHVVISFERWGEPYTIRYRHRTFCYYRDRHRAILFCERLRDVSSVRFGAGEAVNA